MPAYGESAPSLHTTQLTMIIRHKAGRAMAPALAHARSARPQLRPDPHHPPTLRLEPLSTGTRGMSTWRAIACRRRPSARAADVGIVRSARLAAAKPRAWSVQACAGCVSRQTPLRSQNCTKISSDGKTTCALQECVVTGVGCGVWSPSTCVCMAAGYASMRQSKRELKLKRTAFQRQPNTSTRRSHNPTPHSQHLTDTDKPQPHTSHRL
jgi:hypothetical protein